MGAQETLRVMKEMLSTVCLGALKGGRLGELGPYEGNAVDGSLWSP